tara:strand:- start:231 stop:392 length:162 start_codon:yes stop_codon:yes gene_type:complete
LKWLKQKNIEEALYLTTAQNTGTYIHQVMEDYVNAEPLQRNLDDNDEVRETID